MGKAAIDAGTEVILTTSDAAGMEARVFVTGASANETLRAQEPVRARLNEALHGAIHLVSRLCDNGISERERTNCALRARGSLRQLELMIDEVMDRNAHSSLSAVRMEASVSSVIAQVRAAIGPQLMERGLGLRVRDDGGDAIIEGPGTLAAGALSTMAGIAAESLSAGDELELCARLERDMVVLAICPCKSHAEGRGFRLAVAPLSAGTGFLLAAARRFAELHGGALRMPTEHVVGAGYGAEFRLELPRRRLPAGRARKVA